MILATVALPAGMTRLSAMGALALDVPVKLTLRGRAPGEDWVTLVEADLAPQHRMDIHVVLSYTLGRHAGVQAVTTAGSEAQLLATAPLALTLEVA